MSKGETTNKNIILPGNAPIGAIFKEATPEHAKVNSPPGLLLVCKCALADLEEVMPEFEPSGDRQHPGWKTIEELRAAITRIESDENDALWHITVCAGLNVNGTDNCGYSIAAMLKYLGFPDIKTFTVYSEYYNETGIVFSGRIFLPKMPCHCTTREGKKR